MAMTSRMELKLFGLVRKCRNRFSITKTLKIKKLNHLDPGLQTKEKPLGRGVPPGVVAFAECNPSVFANLG